MPARLSKYMMKLCLPSTTGYSMPGHERAKNIECQHVINDAKGGGEVWLGIRGGERCIAKLCGVDDKFEFYPVKPSEYL